MPEPQDPPAWAVEAKTLREIIFERVHRGRDVQRKGVFGWSWMDCENECETLIGNALVAAYEKGRKEENARIVRLLREDADGWISPREAAKDIAARRDENDVK